MESAHALLAQWLAAAALPQQLPQQLQLLAATMASQQEALQQQQQPAPAPAAPPRQQQRQQQPAAVQQAPPKRRRGRPASSTATHPNLIYVRRFRERQKQMERDLHDTLALRKAQVAELQQEQQGLVTKHEALEQVLNVQTNVMLLMQQLALYEQPEEEEQPDTLHAAVAAPGHSGSSRAGGDSPAPAGTAAPAAGAGTAGAASFGSAQLPPGDQTAAAAAAAAAVAAAAAAVSAGRPVPAGVTPQLLHTAKLWLTPVRHYTLRAALMLEQLGMLPDNAAAYAALAAAHADPGITLLPAHWSSMQSAAAAVAAAIAAVAPGACHADGVAAAVVGPPGQRAGGLGGSGLALPAAGSGLALPAAGSGDASMHQQLHAAAAAAVACSDAVEGVPVVRYPYSIGMYVLTPERIKDAAWALNMATWRLDDANNQAHAEAAGRALWAVLRPERWRLLQSTWLTMSRQLQAVQQEFVQLHSLLRALDSGQRPDMQAALAEAGCTSSAAGAGDAGRGPSPSSGCSSDHGASSGQGSAAPQLTDSTARGSALRAAGRQHFQSMHDSTALHFAAVAAQVEAVLLREDAISFQLCGAFLELLDPLEMAVGYCASWPFHPQAFTMFEVMFRLGEPPPCDEAAPRGA